MKSLLVVLLLALTLTFPAPVSAAKKRVRAPRAVAVAYSSVKLSRPTHSAIVTFLNLGRVKRIEYALSYQANGIPQGVLGSFAPSGQASESRDLYFGTCSKGVCTPHYGIAGASLTVTVTLKNGSLYRKRYVFKRV